MALIARYDKELALESDQEEYYGYQADTIKSYDGRVRVVDNIEEDNEDPEENV